jgi:hypothetical protein
MWEQERVDGEIESVLISPEFRRIAGPTSSASWLAMNRVFPDGFQVPEESLAQLRRDHGVLFI